MNLHTALIIYIYSALLAHNSRTQIITTIVSLQMDGRLESKLQPTLVSHGWEFVWGLSSTDRSYTSNLLDVRLVPRLCEKLFGKKISGKCNPGFDQNSPKSGELTIKSVQFLTACGKYSNSDANI